MGTFIRLTRAGTTKEMSFSLIKDKDNQYYLLSLNPDGKQDRIALSREDGMFSIVGDERFEESEDVILDRLAGLSEEFLSLEAEGIEPTEEELEQIDIDTRLGYNLNDIYVDNKQFSISSILELIKQGDLELAPNFQRNFIWDRTRQSLLIESILLGLPLPSIYLSQYPDGILTIVDGLQRINTIMRFMEDRFTLCNLEYLTECNGLTYSQLKEKLPPLRVRRFGQTQLMCFVIDYRSPERLKYDLFRRLNVGGKPLNGQEIRNCLSREPLQKTLLEMCTCKEFVSATDNRVNNRRMQAQEIALRYLYFRKQYIASPPIGDYNGKMEEALNLCVEKFNCDRDYDFTADVEAFKKAMLLARHLFGSLAFRKVSKFQSRRQPINKLLFQCLSVLLSFVDYDTIIDKYPERSAIPELEDLIDNSEEFYRAITYGTNSKWNVATAMNALTYNLSVFKH